MTKDTPQKYLPSDSNRNGLDYYFPDNLVDAVREFRTLPAARGSAEEVYIHPSTAREIITRALTDFDPDLGRRASQIFDSGFREAVTDDRIQDIGETIELSDSMWQVRTVPQGQCRVMRCLPANSDATDLDPANPNDRPVIQFEYDGTIGSLIYLSHEVGHGIADQIMNESGFTSQTNPEHMKETQAYFVQNVIYDALRSHPDASIRDASSRHFTDLFNESTSVVSRATEQPRDLAGMPSETFNDNAQLDQSRDDRLNQMHFRPLSFLSARILSQEARSGDLRASIIGALMGASGPLAINAVMENAGIADGAQLRARVLAAQPSLNSTASSSVVGFAQPARNFS
jgi:hypothetical protein